MLLSNEAAAPAVDLRDINWMRGQLRKYYDHSNRGYPWRQETNPYLILNTEMLLQQTKADDVARSWKEVKEHLSYPERASQSQASEFLVSLFAQLGLPKRRAWIETIAATILEQGAVPTSLAGLLCLPGVGTYTACATLVFAHGKNEGLVDSNILRLFERFWEPFPHHDPRQKIRFWLPISKTIGGRAHAKVVFWGLLDLSSQVCKVRRPLCLDCLLAPRCSAQKTHE